jgi:hypothetical protein
MSGSQQLLLAAVQQAVATDPDFEYTTLLLPGNGTNGAQNNTFLDSSTNNFTITRNGNTTQGTFSPFSQTGWSNFFDGSGDYLSVASNAAFGMGTGDFTLECWVYPTAYNASASVLIDFRSGSEPSVKPDLEYGNTGTLIYRVNGSTVITGGTISLNTWTHVALARSSGTTKMFINGTQSGSSYSDTNNYGATSACRLGADDDGTANAFMTGYMSNARVVKGTAVYTADFTPPTAPLTAITNTSLLTCQSNRFVDNSSNAFAITLNGDVSVQAFSPFNPTAAWSAATNGGSGYFDGSGDYLSVARDNVFLPGANTDFTIEAWVYLTATPGATDAQILGFGEYGLNSDYVFAINSSRQLFFYFSSSNTVCTNTTTLVPLNAWTYVAVSRSGTGSNNLKVFVNGNAASFSVNSTLVGTGGNNLTIGADANGDETNLTGYITNIRFINGTGYTSLTVPTLPLTAITNTQLLTNFTNAGIYDATSKNDLETVGNAQISTAQSKFGGSSMYFDGTGDYVASASSPLLALGTGNLTVEFWFRASSVGTNQRIVQNTVGGFDSTSYILRINGSSKLEVAFAYPDVSASSTTTIANDTWYHVAMVRNGTSVKVYLNGVEEMSGTSSGNMSNQYAYVGGYYNVGPAEYFTGYVQDVRITKGIARYTTAFTPPTTAFPLF